MSPTSFKSVNSNAVLAVTNFGPLRFDPTTNEDLPIYSFLTVAPRGEYGVDFMSGVVSPAGTMQNEGGREQFQVSKGGSAFNVKFLQYDSSGTKYQGECQDLFGRIYDRIIKSGLGSLEECFEFCVGLDLDDQVGVTWDASGGSCSCNYNQGTVPLTPDRDGTGPVAGGNNAADLECYPRKVSCSS